MSEGFDLHTISYSSDDECNEKNIAWMNELAKKDKIEESFTQCIMFKSDFRSSKDDGDGFEANQEYKEWQWWLARGENGNWYLLTWGQ